MEGKSRIKTSQFSSKSGMRGPKLLLRDARSHGTTLRVAVGEEEALAGKGWPR
jgi:hypothetical protein